MKAQTSGGGCIRLTILFSPSSGWLIHYFLLRLPRLRAKKCEGFTREDTCQHHVAEDQHLEEDHVAEDQHLEGEDVQPQVEREQKGDGNYDAPEDPVEVPASPQIRRSTRAGRGTTASLMTMRSGNFRNLQK